MAYNSYDLANTSLVKTGTLTEMYLPLWFYSSGNVTTTATSPSGSFVSKGQTTASGAGTSIIKLHTLNSNWSSTQKFAFEASLYTNITPTQAAYAELWDITSNIAVSGSQVSVTASSFTLVRSGQFTLTPGHTYGVSLWSNGGSANAYLTKASLIAFLS